MLIGPSVTEMARKMIAREAAHVAEIAYWRRLTILTALGALTVGILLGLAL